MQLPFAVYKLISFQLVFLKKKLANSQSFCENVNFVVVNPVVTQIDDFRLWKNCDLSKNEKLCAGNLEIRLRVGGGGDQRKCGFISMHEHQPMGRCVHMENYAHMESYG